MHNKLEPPTHPPINPTKATPFGLTHTQRLRTVKGLKSVMV